MLPRIFAQRYLFSSQSRSVVNLISGLSVVSVAIPVAAMIILMSVFNGFGQLAANVCSAVDAPLTLTPVRGGTFAETDLPIDRIRHTEGVSAVSLVLEQGILLEHEGRQATATLRGVDSAYTEVLPVRDYISAGEWQVELGDFDRMVLGQAMAMQLGLRTLNGVGIDTYAVRRNSFSSLLPFENYTRRRIAPKGIFALDLETEQTYVFTSLRFARDLLRHPGRASALAIGVEDGHDIGRVRKALAETVGDRYRIQTREELKASFYRIMQVEKWGIFLIALLVLVIASFSIVGALAMLIVEKQGDIATLRALGADTALIRRIFRTEGLLICVWGAAAGVAVGVGATLLQQTFGWIEIPAETFLVKSYPVIFRASDLVVILGSFAVIGYTLSLLTARNMIKSKL